MSCDDRLRAAAHAIRSVTSAAVRVAGNRLDVERGLEHTCDLAGPIGLEPLTSTVSRTRTRRQYFT